MTEQLTQEGGDRKMETAGTEPLKQEITVSFQNKQEDLLAALEAIDLKNRYGTRKTIHLLAVALVAYWSIDLIRVEPTFAMSWIMLALAAAVGVYVLREPNASNRKYTARFVERAPTGSAVVDAGGIRLEDGTGRDPYRYADGVKLYEYKNILAIDGGRKRFAMIPLDQLGETQRESLLALVREANYEKVEPQQTGGFFKKK